jgi:hypothetical protein
MKLKILEECRILLFASEGGPSSFIPSRSERAVLTAMFESRRRNGPRTDHIVRLRLGRRLTAHSSQLTVNNTRNADDYFLTPICTITSLFGRCSSIDPTELLP